MSQQSIPKVLSDEEKKRLELMAAQFPGLLEYAHNVGGVPIQPTEEGMIKAQAQRAMLEQTGSTLEILADFMKLAMKHAGQLKDRVELSTDVYGAEIHFQPVIGGDYYLYERSSGKKVLSLVAPDEWGANPPFDFCARLRLLADHTWQILEKRG